MASSPTPPARSEQIRTRLAQIDALQAEGVLSRDAAASARRQLERQLPGAEPQAPARPPRRLVLAVAGFILAFGLAGYGVMGKREGLDVGPGDPGTAAAEAAQTAQIEAMVKRLEARLKSQPDDAEGWAMLARSYTVQGRYGDAVPAWKRVAELRPRNAQALADLADGLAMANNRSLDGEPEKLALQAVQLDPDNVKALVLAGTAAFNRNDAAGAAALWERALKGADPAGDFARQIQGALAEARQRAGLPPLPAMASASGATAGGEPAATVAAAGAAAQASGAAAGATVAGRVSLSAAVQAKVAPGDTVFIFARAPQGSRMPLAILRKKVSDLPLDFRLDDSLAMSPAARLSSASQVVVGARVSRTGNAMPQPGDWQALSAPVAVGAQGLRIEIADAVP